MAGELRKLKEVMKEGEDEEEEDEPGSYFSSGSTSRLPSTLNPSAI